MPGPLDYARSIRAWGDEHPIASTALGFVPGIGTGMGAADTAATVTDPEASLMDKGLAAAGLIPGGRLLKVAKKVMKKTPDVPIPRDAQPRGTQMSEAESAQEYAKLLRDWDYWEKKLNEAAGRE